MLECLSDIANEKLRKRVKVKTSMECYRNTRTHNNISSESKRTQILLIITKQQLKNLESVIVFLYIMELNTNQRGYI